ncbi:GNAT family N-acetyltransferase, partial [Bacteroides xylanisolvens]
EFVTFVNNPDGSPKYEDTCVYAILEGTYIRPDTN